MEDILKAKRLDLITSHFLNTTTTSQLHFRTIKHIYYIHLDSPLVRSTTMVSYSKAGDDSPSWTNRFSAKTLVTLLILVSAIIKASMPINDAVFVPGAGFSGFWYSFGRVNSLAEAESRNYFCFSAGCLAVSARFLNKSFDDVASSALRIQSSWRDGDLSRYNVASEFVDELLDIDVSAKIKNNKTIDETSYASEEWLNHVNVLTTTWYGGVKISKAKERRELRELLLKTSFIPFATGWGGNRDGELDGGFSLLFHPRCKHGIYLPPTMEMLVNILNVNMGFETVKKLYSRGSVVV